MPSRILCLRKFWRGSSFRASLRLEGCCWLRLKRFCGVSIVGVGLSLIVLPVQAFYCTLTDRATDKIALSWFSRQISFALDKSDPQILPGISNDSVFATLRESFKVWEALVPTRGLPCTATGSTDVRFVEDLSLSQDNFFRYHPELGTQGNENFLIFQKQSWSNGSGEGTIALTTVSYNPNNGQILDADIEFNAVTYHFQNQEYNGQGEEIGPDAGKMDLKNVAVHEIGHFLGLAHPLTEQANASATTMYYKAFEGEIIKRKLHCDEVEAILLKYPAGLANGYCSGDVDASCGYCRAPYAADGSSKTSLASTGGGEGCLACTLGSVTSEPAASRNNLATFWLLTGGYLVIYLAHKGRARLGLKSR